MTVRAMLGNFEVSCNGLLRSVVDPANGNIGTEWLPVHKFGKQKSKLYIDFCSCYCYVDLAGCSADANMQCQKDLKKEGRVRKGREEGRTKLRVSRLTFDLDFEGGRMTVASSARKRDRLHDDQGIRRGGSYRFP